MDPGFCLGQRTSSGAGWQQRLPYLASVRNAMNCTLRVAEMAKLMICRLSLKYPHRYIHSLENPVNSFVLSESTAGWGEASRRRSCPVPSPACLSFAMVPGSHSPLPSRCVPVRTPQPRAGPTLAKPAGQHGWARLPGTSTLLPLLPTATKRHLQAHPGWVLPGCSWKSPPGTPWTQVHIQKRKLSPRKETCT